MTPILKSVTNGERTEDQQLSKIDVIYGRPIVWVEITVAEIVNQSNFLQKLEIIFFSTTYK